MYNHQLDTFIKTADLGSFGKAGEALYISSTAVIQQINLLENLCGFKLFVRSNHGVIAVTTVLMTINLNLAFILSLRRKC